MKCENCVRPDPCGGRVNEDGECDLHRTAEEWKREHSDTPEPLAAILAEMRDERIIRLDGADVTRCLLRNLADRIDAAVKREIAQWRGETNAAKEERNRIACKMRYEFSEKCRACKAEPGNAAAIREALMKIRDKCVIYNNDLAEEIDALCGNALAAPARNCDLYPNWETALPAWAMETGEEVDSKTGFRDNAQLKRFLDWIYAPAEGGAE